MATGKPIGTGFAQIDLDSTKLEQGLKRVNEQLVSGSIKVEDAYKSLGIKSDLVYDMMRKNATAAVDFIKNKTLSSKEEIIRAETAAAAKIQSLNNQQYGAQVSWIDKLKANWIAASVAIYAAWAIVQKAWNYAEIAAQFEEMEAGLQGLSAKYNMTADSAIAMAKEAVSGQLSMMEAGKLAAKAFALGFDPKQVKEFLTVSERLTDAMGGTIPEAFDAMERAAATGRKGGLVGIGINIDLKKTLSDYADKMGIAKESISGHLATQIRANAIMVEAKKITDQLGVSTDSTADKMNRMRAIYADTELIMGQLAIRGGSLLIGALYGIGSAAMTVYAGMMRVAQGFYGLLSMIPGVGAAYKGLYAESKAAADGAWAKTKEYSDKSGELVQTAFADRKLLSKATMKLQDDEAENFKAKKSEEQKAAERLNEEFNKMKFGLQEDIKGAGLEGIRKEFEANLTTYEKTIEESKKFSAAKQAEIEVLAREKMALADKGIIDKTTTKSREDYTAELAKETEARLKASSEYEQIMDRENTYSGDKYQETINKIIEQEKEKYKKLEELGKAAQKTDAQIEADKFKVHQDTQAKITAIQMDAASEVFGAWSNALEGISQLYAQGSEEQKKYHDMAVAFALVEKGIIAAKAVVLGVEAVINAMAEGDGYTAVVRGLAVAAVVAAYLAQIGTAFNTSGGGGGSAAADNTPTYTGVSTVLGASDQTGSESITNSLKLLEDTYSMEYTKLTSIYNQLKNLNDNITGLVTSIVRTGGISSEGMNLNLKSTPDLGTGSPMFGALNHNGGVGELLQHLDPVSGILATAQNITNAIWGGGTTSGIQQAGIAIGQTIVKNILAGADVAAQQYALVATIHNGGMFSSDWVSRYTAYSKLDQNVTDMITLVFKNIGSTLVELAKALGTDTQAVLNYVFKQTQINLNGMTSDEMNKALQEYISNISDTAVSDLFGSMLKGYQKLNEGLMETAVRLITDQAVMEEMLKMTNQSFTGTIPEALKFSEALITIAGGLDKLTEAMQTYYDAFFSDTEKEAKLKEQMTSMLGQYGFDLPGTRGGYRDLVESLNLTTDAGMTAYAALMQMSKSADEYYKYLEQAKGNINPAQYSTNLEYQRALAGLPKYADGGIASGPMTGYSATLHGTELVVSPRKSYPVTVKGEGNVELVAEVKALREEVASMNRNVTANTYKTANNTEYLESWDSKGLPT